MLDIYGSNYTGPQNVASGIKPMPQTNPNPSPPQNPPKPPTPPAERPPIKPSVDVINKKPIKPLPKNLQITGPSLELEEKEKSQESTNFHKRFGNSRYNFRIRKFE